MAREGLGLAGRPLADDPLRPARQRGRGHGRERGEELGVLAMIKCDAMIDRLVADATGGTATADAAPLVDDERLTSGRRERAGAGEAGDPGADDDDLVQFFPGPAIEHAGPRIDHQFGVSQLAQL